MFRYIFISLLVSVPASANLLLLNFNGNTTTVSLANSYSVANRLKLFVYPNSSIQEIKRDTLPQILADIENENITTVIFSGHAGHSFFSGKSGVLSRKDFMAVAKDFTKFQQSVTSVYARGCYSATKGDFFGNNSWLELFPNLNFVAGYEGKAWSSETPQSQSFVKDLLELKDEFLTASSETALLTTYKKFERHYDSEAAVWVKQSHATYYVSTVQLSHSEPVINFIKAASGCEALAGKMQSVADEIGRYFAGTEADYHRPPENYATGPLRQSYSWVLQNQHCKLLEVWDDKKELNPHLVMALLFFDKLTKNYSQNFSLSAYQQSLDWLATVSGKKFEVPNIFTASRANIREFSMNVMSISHNPYAEPSLQDKADSYELKLLQYHAKAFHLIVSELEPSYIPHRWLTEDHSNDIPFGLIMPSRIFHGTGSILN